MSSYSEKKYTAQHLTDERFDRLQQNYENLMMKINGGLTPSGQNVYQLLTTASLIYNYYIRILIKEEEKRKRLDSIFNKIKTKFKDLLLKKYNDKKNKLNVEVSYLITLIDELDNFMSECFSGLQSSQYFYFTVSYMDPQELIERIEAKNDTK